jgi:Phage integrase, N-terminal SAM-like domain
VKEWKRLTLMRDDGEMPIASNLSLSDLATKALADLESKIAAEIRSQRTYDLYKGHWQNHIKPVLGRKTLSKLGPADVLQLVAHLRAEGMAEWTGHAVITTLRHFLAFRRRPG